MTDGVTDNMVVRVCPCSIPGWVLKIEKKPTMYICIIYLICNIFCIYLICILYILYIAYICRIKSECYLNRASFTRYIVEPTLPMMLRITSSYEDVLVQYQVGSRKKKKKAYILLMYYISYM